MATKRNKGLGRGLDVLLESRIEDGSQTAQAVKVLALGQLVPGQYQPRTRMDEGSLYELAESIRAQGIMQPILVRRLPRQDVDGAAQYEIIAGERRFRAAHLAGLDEVPVLVRDVPDEAAAAMSLIENIQREDLNPLEEAQGLQRLVQEFGLTHEQAAQAVGRSRSTASNLLRLLQLGDAVQTMLMAGDLDMGHARALLALEGAAQITAAHQIVGKKMSVREAERLVRKMADPASAAPTATARPGADKSADVLQVERELSDLLAAQVEIQLRKSSARQGTEQQHGVISIHFASLDEVNGLIDRLRGAASSL